MSEQTQSDQTYTAYAGKRLSLAAIERNRASSAKRKRERRAAGERIDYDLCACGREKFHGSTRCKACKDAEQEAMDREACELRALGLLNHEIAARLGTTAASVANRLSRIRREGGLVAPTTYDPATAMSIWHKRHKDEAMLP
jgi:DNA-binding NarL/FixJ family response regulator